MLIVGYRQDAAILDSWNVLDPPRLCPQGRTALRDVDEAMLQDRRIGSAGSESGACEGRVSYREERVCSQDGGVTVLEHDRVPCVTDHGQTERRGKQKNHWVPRMAYQALISGFARAKVSTRAKRQRR